MPYIIQITVYSAMFFTVYLLFLRNRAAHQWNRYYLLASALLPLILPFIKVPVFNNPIPVSGINTINNMMPAVTIFANKHEVVKNTYDWGGILLAAYSSISLGILLNIVYQYFRFKRFVKQHRYEEVNGVKVVLGTNAGPGSFLNTIFFPGNEIDPIIFSHELAHIRFKHSLDILFIRLLQCLFWPNIVLHFIFKELKIVHEFQADSIAVTHEVTYINTLLNNIFSTRQFSLSNAFFYQPIQRRIRMLQQKPVSNSMLWLAKLKAFSLALIVMAGIVYLQSCRHADKGNAVITQQKKIENIKTGLRQEITGTFFSDDSNSKNEVLEKIVFSIDDSGGNIQYVILNDPYGVDTSKLFENLYLECQYMSQYMPGVNSELEKLKKYQVFIKTVPEWHFKNSLIVLN